jgi:hypothetical protein
MVWARHSSASVMLSRWPSEKLLIWRRASSKSLLEHLQADGEEMREK